MAEPSCKIEWFYEGYRAVWLYDGTGMSAEDFREVCIEVAHAIEGAETVPDLTAAIEQAVARHKLGANVHPGPSHLDPLQQHVTVGVFAKGDRRLAEPD